MKQKIVQVRAERTQEDVARELGLTKQGVYKIEKRAMAKLRENPITRKLLDQILEAEK